MRKKIGNFTAENRKISNCSFFVDSKNKDKMGTKIENKNSGQK